MDYTIPNLFLEAFGIKLSGIYNPQISGGATAPNGIYGGMEIVQDINRAKEMSFLGTPILFPITLMEGSYKKYRQDGSLDTAHQMREFRLPITSVVDFDRAKNMSVTNINGGRSTVKEIYGFEDWNIQINGFLLPDPMQPQGFTTPLAQEEELYRWDELACSVDVLSELFSMRDIASITIKNISIRALRGKPNIRPFSIQALSDEPIELLIRNT